MHQLHIDGLLAENQWHFVQKDVAAIIGSAGALGHLPRQFPHVAIRTLNKRGERGLIRQLPGS